MTQMNGFMIVNGRKISQSNSINEIINPATEEIIGTVPLADQYITDDAINAAHAAFPEWSHKSVKERAVLLHGAAKIIRDKAESIGKVLTLEHGKPLSEAIGEVKGAAEAIDYYAEEVKRVRGLNYWQDNKNMKSQSFYQPMGVVGIIAPFNYPLILAAYKLGPALASGNTVVVKSPSDTPLALGLMIECFIESGFLNGEVNLLNGNGNEVGKWFIENPLLQKISFTGSTTAGKKIMSMAGNYIKRLTLELGGNSPVLVFADADIDTAAREIVYRAFRNMGQVCNSINRVYVEEPVFQIFTDMLVAGARKMVIGDGLKDSNVEIGPMTSADGHRRVEEHVKDALEKGAHLECGGKRPDGFNKGYFYEPTVLTHVNHDMKVMCEETFGPVAPVMTFSGVDEGIRLANDTIYGLVAYVYTHDLAKAIRVSENLQYGTVGVNNVTGGATGYPYSGWKQSGIGIEFSEDALFEYLNVKHVRIKL